MMEKNQVITGYHYIEFATTEEQANKIWKFAEEWIKNKEWKKRLPEGMYNKLYNIYNEVLKGKTFYEVMSKYD